MGRRDLELSAGTDGENQKSIVECALEGERGILFHVEGTEPGAAKSAGRQSENSFLSPQKRSGGNVVKKKRIRNGHTTREEASKAFPLRGNEDARPFAGPNRGYGGSFRQGENCLEDKKKNHGV